MSRSSMARAGQRGATAVEFALIVMVFLTIIFGIIELARMMYLFNTLQEVTRRAAREAAATSFRDTSALDDIRQRAIFRDSAGTLILGAPVTDQYVHIDYLALTSSAPGVHALEPVPAASLPNCPGENRRICMANPADPQCIRFVRVRICEPGSDATCDRVPYQSLVSFIVLPLNLPIATTIAPVESLGYEMSGTPCE